MPCRLWCNDKLLKDAILISSCRCLAEMECGLDQPFVWSPPLFTPRFLGSVSWVFHATVSWSETYFYQTQAMEQTLRHYGPRARDPRLIVTAVDIEAGKPQAFDSWQDRITAGHVVSCGSLPSMFPAKEVDVRFYWDGGL
jgi:NTE family protein